MDYVDLLKEEYKKYSSSESCIESFANFFNKKQDLTTELTDLIIAISDDKEQLNFSGLECVRNDDNTITFTLSWLELTLTKEQAFNFLCSTIQIIEHVLPLGTVVDLKREKIRNISDKSIEHFRIIITERFVYHSELKAYFEYVGVIYPIGKVSRDSIIQFTPNLIENVVHLGYSDIQEEEFIKLLKSILVVEKSYKSMAFLPNEKYDLFQKIIEEVRTNE